MTDETQHRKMRPSLVNQISLGNLIQIVAFVGAVYGGYVLVKAQGEQNQREIAGNKTTIASQELRIRQLENAVTRQDERYTSIMTLLGRIDAKVDRLDFNGQNGR